jgi:hypothetical protein
MPQEVWQRLLVYVLPQPKTKVRLSPPDPIPEKVRVFSRSLPYEPWAPKGSLDSFFRHLGRVQAWQKDSAQDEPLDSIEFKRALRRFGIK